MNRPRIPAETRSKAASRLQEAVQASHSPITIGAAQVAADSVIESVWSKLLADASDRVASLITAANAYLEAEAEKTPVENIAAKRRRLKRALAMLEDR